MFARYLTLCAVLVLATGAAHATFLFNWDDMTQPHIVYVPDPDDAGGGGGYDILNGIWWAEDGQYQYFRMDLEAQPTAITDAGDIYGIYIDANGTSGTMTNGTPSEFALLGIDYHVLAGYVHDFSTGYQEQWDGSAWVNPPGGTIFQQQLDPTTGHWVLEWGVPIANLPQNFSFYGGIVDMYPTPSVGLDVTDRGLTPEPCTMALLGLGLGGLYLKRRRRQ